MERYLRAHLRQGRQRSSLQHRGPKPFITISRQAGAGGHALADALIASFDSEEDGSLFDGWQIFDRRLCEIVADKPSYSNSLEGLVAEDYRTRADEFFHQFLRSTVDQRAVMERVFRVVRAVASVGNAIIIGRAGAQVTKDMTSGLHVRLVAPEVVRVKGVMDFYTMDGKNAKAEAKRLDIARARLVKTHFGADIADPTEYDVVFNTGQMPIESISEFMVHILKRNSLVSSGAD